jgi:hypothetical protein
MRPLQIAACAAIVSILPAAGVVHAQARDPNVPHQQRGDKLRDTSAMSLDKLTADWTDVSKKALKEMQQKYGDPDGVMPNRLVWTKKGPFAEIILLNAAYDHNFPKPHKDCLEHLVIYDVPVEKVGELAKYDGSIIVDRTRGTISARCDSEAHNLFALNLAHDVITGKKSVQEARQAYADAAKQEMQGQMPEIGKKLMFEPAKSIAEAGDPDVAITGDQAGDQAQPAGARDVPGGDRSRDR